MGHGDLSVDMPAEKKARCDDGGEISSMANRDLASVLGTSVVENLVKQAAVTQSNEAVGNFAAEAEEMATDTGPGRAADEADGRAGGGAVATANGSRVAGSMENPSGGPETTAVAPVLDSGSRSDQECNMSSAVTAEVMPGDVVRSQLHNTGRLGWVCCITSESDEAHVYWQPPNGVATSQGDSRESVGSMECLDRALIPGDIVRWTDGSEPGAGNRPDSMGMIVNAEVVLDLRPVGETVEETSIRRSVPAGTLTHLVPMRLVTWVVHRTSGWLGRVISWDEDAILRIQGANSSETPGSESSQSSQYRCRVPAANLRPGLTMMDGFYRDFFPGLTLNLYVKDFASWTKDYEWLTGPESCSDGDTADPASVSSRFWESHDATAPSSKLEAVIEEIEVGFTKVEWIAQVPMSSGASAHQPPTSERCSPKDLLFLLGEMECSCRWALGDRLRLDGALLEVCNVQTFVDVRWQDSEISSKVPARKLQLSNPDAFSFFPSEIVCERIIEGVEGPAPRSPSKTSIDNSGLGGDREGAGVDNGPPMQAEYSSQSHPPTPSAPSQPRIGCVVRADPGSRMVRVRWLAEGSEPVASPNGEATGDVEEEWSAFDLQIDPEYGYRLGDAVLRCGDWEEAFCKADAKSSTGPRVGQVAALDAGRVVVRWLDGTVSSHGPRELYRVADDEDGNMEQEEAALGDDEASDKKSLAILDELQKSLLAKARAKSTEGVVSSGTRQLGEGGDSTDEQQVDAAADAGPEADATAPPAATPEAEAAATTTTTTTTTTHTAPATATATAAAADMEEDTAGERVEVSFEEMACDVVPKDHHFLHASSLPTGPSARQFMRRVQKEWQILQLGLPRGVWVHLYPERMDLMRACLAGPEGTPYADALFFFDVCLPPTYPQHPPQVWFWSFGESLNPNLYENGKVCLSLLGTWSGKESETWSPERSNLLQVLVSILGLVLNMEPYYNEPGFERERETPEGSLRSQRYNESAALSSFHLMLRVLRAGPVDFSTEAKRHFAERRSAILERARRLQRGEVSVACCSASPAALPRGAGSAATGSAPGVGSEGFRRSLVALLPRLEEMLPKEPPL
mmetsp:Transcript_12953/g.28730  ORF Transcript_12953/g.28730 Transcript_12953/m.28730 type:complete len:1084 (+) Transcript_12953:196-3447(+)